MGRKFPSGHFIFLKNYVPALIWNQKHNEIDNIMILWLLNHTCGLSNAHLRD